ncbi:putative receptor-type tyrosine-protein phosphatase mu-like [Apostichopus japonicus]|uniref:Putative receptor-type tyrosine-protein phosphatase mu-like n=1 Tax=Stichopus japonicus TaxID=307972 RepID=A0A2G8KJY2_STIJA|nr:putative receptor-type tyrosine-protein phosphatase mu-like [Apostichopus japonicus]
MKEARFIISNYKPQDFASESLSQVNPQSSVEIKCILEGSTAVVNRLEIRLSRSEQMIDDSGITQETDPDISANRIEVTYRVISVSEDDQFFCFLSLRASIFGSINVTGFVYKLPFISDPPTEVTRTTTSVTITWRPWNEETDVGDPPVVAYIPYYRMDPSQDWMSGSRIQPDQTLEYAATSLESDRNYTFSVAAVRAGEGGEGPRGPAVTIKTLCIDVIPQMVTTTFTAKNDVTVTWQQPTVQCSTGITLFTIYYEIEGDVSSRKAAGTADSNVETFTVDGSLLEPGTTYNIAVTVTTDQESAMSEGSTVTTTNSTSNLDRMNNNPAGEPPSSSPVYLVALVIPVLLIIILLVVIIKRIRRKPATESKPVDAQDVDYVNAGVTDDPGDYIALEEQSKNTPAPKYQDLTEKEAPTQISRYERTILDTADAAPKAMPRQGLKRQTDYQYEDVNLGETDARKLPSVPQPDLQSEDDTEYEVPDMFEEYTGVHINTLRASKPITPRPMKITEYKTFMGRERSKVISEIAQQYMALKTGQQHPWTAAVKLQNKPKNFFKALLPYDHSRVRLDTDGSDIRSDFINASYIKNHQGKVSFIAAQGPREGTKNDFWRMVWQGDVEIIVMLVDKDGTEQGNEKVLTSVRQYEIPCWKYGGVPSEPADLISVIKQIKNHQNGGKHLLVHCSSSISSSLMLCWKPCCLQIMSCDQLKKLDLSAIKKKSKKEFQILQENNKMQEDFSCLAGISSENSHKNRFHDILPVDKFRPVLKSPSNLFGSSDYINATIVKDISEREIIMTQSPLASTVEDFWRLVFDYNCTSIVMLNTIDDSDESVTEYWPGGQGGTGTNGLMTVICKKIEKSDVFTRRQFEVNHKRSQVHHQ